MQFTASTISGSNRGKQLGFPTINLNPKEIPDNLEYGIYACRANDMDAVAHYGLRPVFEEDVAFEVHILDSEVSKAPEELTVEIVQKLRDVEDFDSADALTEQIAKDCDAARAILNA